MLIDKIRDRAQKIATRKAERKAADKLPRLREEMDIVVTKHDPRGKEYDTIQHNQEK